MLNADRIPVIAGIGEITDRAVDPLDALEPLALMEAALRRADADSGGTLLARADSIDVVNQISWPYAAPADELSARLGIAPPRRNYGAVGGETPITFLHEAAARIARGESAVAAICGGEAHQAIAKARASDITLPWTAPAERPAPSIRSQDRAHSLAKQLGAHLPVTVYPFYENASAHHWGQAPVEAYRESADLLSAFSRIAASNPFAWLQRSYSADEIATPGEGNRPIAHPYSKLMVANIAVNQGAGLILTSLAIARAAGLDDGRLIFPHQGWSAAEPADYLDRDGYARSHARDVVLEHAAAAAPENGFDAVELYSCFPCVPKAARRTLLLPPNMELSVTGGLTFFGAPLNNYMAHATCAMVRRLRGTPGTGLLYGQGGFVTKHHVLTLGSAPASTLDATLAAPDRQTDVARRYGPVPHFVEAESGRATVETHTVIHARDGNRHGVAILRTPDGARTMARIPATDTATLALLEDEATFAVGWTGTLVRAADGITEWRAGR